MEMNPYGDRFRKGCRTVRSTGNRVQTSASATVFAPLRWPIFWPAGNLGIVRRRRRQIQKVGLFLILNYYLPRHFFRVPTFYLRRFSPSFDLPPFLGPKTSSPRRPALTWSRPPGLFAILKRVVLAGQTVFIKYENKRRVKAKLVNNNFECDRVWWIPAGVNSIRAFLIAAVTGRDWLSW